MTHAPYLRQVRVLQALPDREFATAVYQWVRNRKSTPQDAAPFRDPEIIERTLLAIDTLIDTTEAGIEKISSGARTADAESKIRFRREMLRTLRTHRRAIRGAAHEEAERRAQVQRGKGPRHRAMVRLSKLHPVDFLALVREEQSREDALGEDRDLLDDPEPEASTGESHPVAASAPLAPPLKGLTPPVAAAFTAPEGTAAVRK